MPTHNAQVTSTEYCLIDTLLIFLCARLHGQPCQQVHPKDGGVPCGSQEKVHMLETFAVIFPRLRRSYHSLGLRRQQASPRWSTVHQSQANSPILKAVSGFAALQLCLGTFDANPE